MTRYCFVLDADGKPLAPTKEVKAWYRLGKDRYDVLWIDTKLDSKLKKEIEDFPNKTLPHIYKLLDKYKENKKCIFFILLIYKKFTLSSN